MRTTTYDDLPAVRVRRLPLNLSHPLVDVLLTLLVLGVAAGAARHLRGECTGTATGTSSAR